MPSACSANPLGHVASRVTCSLQQGPWQGVGSVLRRQVWETQNLCSSSADRLCGFSRVRDVHLLLWAREGSRQVEGQLTQCRPGTEGSGRGLGSFVSTHREHGCQWLFAVTGIRASAIPPCVLGELKQHSHSGRLGGLRGPGHVHGHPSCAPDAVCNIHGARAVGQPPAELPELRSWQVRLPGSAAASAAGQPWPEPGGVDNGCSPHCRAFITAL